MKPNLLKSISILLLILNVNFLQAQCTGCNVTITVPNSSTFSLTAGQTICIVGTGAFTGRLNNFNGNTLCIGTGVNYNPSVAPNYNGNWTIINNGTFTNTTNLNFNSGVNFTNAATGSITLPAITINSGVSFVNNGTLTTSGVTVNSGGSVTLGGTSTINGPLNNNGSVIVSGVITASQITNNSGATVIGGPGTNCNSIRSTGSFTNNGVFGNTGTGLYVGNVGGTINSPATSAGTVAPTTQPTNLNLSISGTTVSGNFTQTSTYSDGYLVLRALSTGAAPAVTNPTNFASVVVGQTIGAWTIVAINNTQTSTSFSDNIGTNCTNAYYRIYSFKTAGTSLCRVYNTSSVLTSNLTLVPTVTAVSPTTNSSICNGTNVLLNATSTGNNINWYTVASGGTAIGTSASGVDFSVAPSATTTYYAEAVTSTGCVSITRTATATITVTNISPSIEFTQGANDHTATISGCGTVGGGTQNDMDIFSGDPGAGSTYQWQFSDDNITWTDAAGPTSTTAQFVLDPLYTTIESTAGVHYIRLKITYAGCTGYSNINTLTVTSNSNLTSGTINSNQSFCGSSGDPLAFTVTAPTGGNGTYSYLWQSSTDNVNFTTISGATSATYNAPVISQTTYYRRIVVSGGCSKISNTITVSIIAQPTITPSASATSVCFSSSAQTTPLTYSATTSSPNTYSISWNASPANSFVTVTNAALVAGSITINIPANTAAGTYTGNLSVRNASGCVSSTSVPFTVTVIAIPTITGTTPGTTNGPGTVTLGATASAGTISWYAAASGGSALATGTSFTTPVISATTTYYVETVNNGCTSSPRVAVVATYTNNPEINVRGNAISIVSGDVTPSLSDWTDFGGTDVNIGTLTRTFTIYNTGINNLTLSNPTISGTNAADFTVTTLPSLTVSGGSSTTFVVTFNPSATGTRTATISIVNNDSNENPYTYAIAGTGIIDIDSDGIDASIDIDNDNDGIIDTIECAACVSDPFVNGSFESPVIPFNGGWNTTLPQTSFTGWQTTATDGMIELWPTGGNGGNAAQGTQFAELNANQASTLYQSFCLNGSSGTITWSIKHRGRSGTDQAFVRFGSTLANALASAPIATMVDGNTTWGTYSGTYTIPVGQTQIVLAFQSGFTSTGDQTIGNFIDDVQISIVQGCIDTDGDGVANVDDLDSDNDGIPDIEEANFKGFANNTSTMYNGTWADANGNGMNDSIDTMIAGSTYTIPDTDGDGIANYLDLDSDNDSLFDVDEAGLLNGDGDINDDGKGDGADADGDGILNLYDNAAIFGTTYRANALDTDANGVSDYLQLDSNSDGTKDIQTSLYGSLDANNDGKIDGSTDADRDGIVDTFDTNTAAIGSPRNLNRKLELDFDGRNDYGQENVQILDNLSGASLMAWVDLNSAFSTDGVIIGQNKFQIRVTSARNIEAVVNSTTLTYSTVALNTSQWYHVGAVYGGGTLKLFLNGTMVASVAASGNIISDGSKLTIGKDPSTNTKYFKGKLDELRVFNVALADAYFQRMVYQEIQNVSSQTRGKIVPVDVGVPFTNVLRCFSMDGYKDDIIDDITTAAIDVTGMKIYNNKNIYVQQAPMPFVTERAGNFATAVNSPTNEVRGLDIMDQDWSIVQVKHDITETTNNVDLGMIVDAGVTVTMNNDTKIQNDWYLLLNGKIDLQGKSQLLQTVSSTLDATSAGSIERDQQGTKNIYNYNYWASPVGAINATTNNNSFTVAGVMKDGTSGTPQNITWTSGVNGSPTSPITLSSYWIFKFQNLSNSYANWASVGQNGTLNVAQGFTLKGSGTAAANQNYTFVGKPNNGTITTTVAAGNLNLTGNPYPSALDSANFIIANTATTTGTLYFWEHASSNNTHNLVNYQGGYSVRNLVGGTGPTAPAGINGVGTSSKIPGRYVPVGQGFFMVGSATGGNITFNNNQRLFIKEDNAASTYMFKNTNTSIVANTNTEDPITSDTFKRVRLGLTSKDNYHRQILLGFMEQYATSAVESGYDAPSIDNQLNDMYFMNNGAKLNIEGEGYFDVNNVYPIGIKTNVLGEVKIMVDATENMNSNQRLFILDNTDGQYHDITNNPYIVELPQGLTENRFTLTFKDNHALLSNDAVDLNTGITIAYANASNILNIKNNVVDATVEKVTLFNLLGQSVGTFDVKDQNQQNIQLPIKDLSSGTYIVKVKTDKGETTRKIVFN